MDDHGHDMKRGFVRTEYETKIANETKDKQKEFLPKYSSSEKKFTFYDGELSKFDKYNTDFVFSKHDTNFLIILCL